MLFKKLTLLVLGTLLLAKVFGQKIIEDAQVEQRHLGAPFTAVKIMGNMEAWLSQDATESLAVSANNEGDRMAIHTEVKDGVLHISGGRGARKGRGRVYISFKTLKSLEMGGIVSLKVVGSIQQETLSLSISGMSDFEGAVTLKNLIVSLKGKSHVNLRGKVAQASVVCSGTSEFEGSNLEIDKAIVVASGSSNIRITVSSELTVTASGSSGVVYRGTSTVINKTLSGSSILKKAD